MPLGNFFEPLFSGGFDSCLFTPEVVQAVSGFRDSFRYQGYPTTSRGGDGHYLARRDLRTRNRINPTFDFKNFDRGRSCPSCRA